MTDIDAKSLLLVLDKETAKKVWYTFKGCRITFPKCECEQDEIASMYRNMVKSGTRKPDAIKRLAEVFEFSERNIRRIIKKEVELFADTD
jgi:hypothetical protein